jgi:peptidoglycan-associated lipoprotein
MTCKERSVMKLHWIWVGVVLSAYLAGCAGPSGTTVDDGLYNGSAGEAGAEGAAAAGIDEGTFQEGSEFGPETRGEADVLENRVVYFEFDKYDIGLDYISLLEAHGRYLGDNPMIRVRLEGHADERGSREYNIGLGERRAQAVKQVLLLQGASAGQLSTVSYGEERPAVLGSDEESWSLNRRVELVYIQ